METTPSTVKFGPSQWLNIGWFLLALAVILVFPKNPIGLIPILIFFWKFLQVECWKYILSENSEVLIQRKGVFSVKRLEVHYFRIKSIRIVQPFYLRIVGLSNIEIITSEPFVPFLRIPAVPHATELAEALEEMAEEWREIKGVKETDFHRF
jgi:uncharacterized membrane protein YdbT with pleckstrin-like domain